MKQSKSLILGASGFLGLNLLRALVARGEYPRILMRPGYSFSRLKSLRESYDLRLGDFMDDSILAQSLEGIETVYHLITTTFPSTTLHSSVYDLSTNLIPTIRLVESCLKEGVHRIVYASSGGTIYGEPTTPLIGEDHPLLPTSAYGQSKLMIESYLNFYARMSPLQVNVLRISNPFGEEQKPFGFQGVIAAAMNAARHGEAFQVIGEGDSVRDYLYVQDVIRGLILASESKESWVLNISSGVGRSVMDVLRAVEGVTGKKIAIEKNPARSGDVKVNVLNNSRAWAKIGWKPEVSFEEGLQKTWEWFGKQHPVS